MVRWGSGGWRWAVAIVALTVTTRSVVWAQAIRGRVLSRAVEIPVSGAVVLLLDTAQVWTQARALANERGEFTLQAPAPGVYRISALRLGFRPTTTQPFVVTRDTTFDVGMTDIPVELPAVTTSDRNQSRVRPDSGLAAFASREEPKPPRLAAALTRDDRGHRFDA